MGFEHTLLTATEGVTDFVTVCVNSTEDLSHGFGSATLNISTHTLTATGQMMTPLDKPQDMLTFLCLKQHFMTLAFMICMYITQNVAPSNSQGYIF